MLHTLPVSMLSSTYNPATDPTDKTHEIIFYKIVYTNYDSISKPVAYLVVSYLLLRRANKMNILRCPLSLNYNMLGPKTKNIH